VPYTARLTTFGASRKNNHWRGKSTPSIAEVDHTSKVLRKKSLEFAPDQRERFPLREKENTPEREKGGGDVAIPHAENRKQEGRPSLHRKKLALGGAP